MPQFSGPPYQDHLPPELRAQSAEDRAQLLEQSRQPKTYPPPRPGYGTVWVMPPQHDPADDDVWSGSWQDEGNRMSEVDGSYRQVRDWVQDQPAAAKVIFIASLGDHIDVDDAAWERALRRDPGPTPMHICGDHDPLMSRSSRAQCTIGGWYGHALRPTPRTEDAGPAQSSS